MIKPSTVTESRNYIFRESKGQSAVECRFPQSSEICDVIAVEPQLSLISAQVASGRVNYSGKLILTIVYSDEEGKLCRMQKGVEFSHYLDDEAFAPAQSCLCKLRCEKLNTKRDLSSFVVSAVISAEISVFARAERCLLIGCEGAYINTEKVNLSSVAAFSGEGEVEDDFEADCVEDILIPSCKAVVLSAECGNGDIEICGELYLSLFAMRESPVCLEKCIPFKNIIPCEEAAAGQSVFANAEISELTVSAGVNEDRGTCSVSIVCSLSFGGYLTEERQAEVARDAYSEECELTMQTADEEYFMCGAVKVYSERVKGLAATKDRLGYDCAFNAAVMPSVECEYNAVTGCAEGAISCMLIYSQEGEIKSTPLTLPVSVPLGGAAENNCRISLDAAAFGIAVRLKAEGEVEAEANLKICARCTECKKSEYLSSVAEGGKTDAGNYALSVFVPSAGDTLWQISKRLKRSPQEVSALNSGLSFPLTGRERIVVYRKG